MAGGAETPNIAALPAIVLIGAGSGRRSAREAIDLSNDGGVTLGRLFTAGPYIWVNLVILTVGRPLPVYRYKQTFSEPLGTWQKCQGAMPTEPLS